MIKLLLWAVLGAAVPLQAMAGTLAASAAYPWPDFADLLTQVAQRSGGEVRLYRLTLDHAGVAEILIQNPQTIDLIDRYRYDEGELTGPQPVKFSRYPSLAAIEQHLIDPRRIDFAALRQMVDAACEVAELPNASVTDIELERGDAHGTVHPRTVVWRIDVKGESGYASVDFDRFGRVLHVNRH